MQRMMTRSGHRFCRTISIGFLECVAASTMVLFQYLVSLPRRLIKNDKSSAFLRCLHSMKNWSAKA